MGLGKALLIIGLLRVLKRCDTECRIGKENVKGKFLLQVKLVNGTDGCSGRVEVSHEGQWGTICGDHWDLNGAQVACRQVGCGTALTAKRWAFFGEGLGKIWLDEMRCYGNESSLDDCPHNGYGGHGCCNHTMDAGVICSNIDACQEDGDICGVKGTCENREGSYWCNCSAGYSNYGNKRTPCSELQCDQFKADSTQSSSGLSNILSLMWKSCTDLSEGKPSHGDVLLEIFTAVEDLLESPDHLNNSDNSNKVTGLLQAVEDAVRLIGPQLQDNYRYTHIETNQTEAELVVRKGKTPPTGPIHLSSHSATLDTDWQTLNGNGTYPGFALAVLVSYKNLEKSVNHSFQHLSGHQNDGVNYQVYSKVVSVVVSNRSTELLDKPVILTMRHLQEGKNTSKVKFICAYWKSGPQGQDTEEGAWATDGCTEQSTNSTHTVCRCKHIKSFAVLMALYPMEALFELELLTILGLVTSLLCLLACICTFGFCRSIKGTRTTIHLHLCICLFIADFIFLFWISHTESKVGCGLVAALLHYFFLGMFFWMLLEGVQLYRMVKPIKNADEDHPWYLYPVGYGTPLVIMVISNIYRLMNIGYGTEQHCWLPLEHGFIWSFNGPVIGIILLNVLFFTITTWKLAKKFKSINPDLSNPDRIKAFTCKAFALLCVLGLTWVFGFFLFENGTVAVVYIFTILNSLQGTLIFVMHCLLCNKVREWYIKKLSLCTRQENQFSRQSQGNPSDTGESIVLAQL